jgi:hypothetical protein
VRVVAPRASNSPVAFQRCRTGAQAGITRQGEGVFDCSEAGRWRGRQRGRRSNEKRKAVRLQRSSQNLSSLKRFSRSHSGPRRRIRLYRRSGQDSAAASTCRAVWKRRLFRLRMTIGVTAACLPAWPQRRGQDYFLKSCWTVAASQGGQRVRQAGRTEAARRKPAYWGTESASTTN